MGRGMWTFKRQIARVYFPTWFSEIKARVPFERLSLSRRREGKASAIQIQWKSRKFRTAWTEGRTVPVAFCPASVGAHHRTCVRYRCIRATSAIASARATMDKGHEPHDDTRNVACAFFLSFFFFFFFYKRRMCRKPIATLLGWCAKGRTERGRGRVEKRERKRIRRIGEKWKRSKREQSEAWSSKFALNSQIIENAVPVSAHNAYRSRTSLSGQLLSGSLCDAAFNSLNRRHIQGMKRLAC